MTTYVTGTNGGFWNVPDTWNPKGIPGAADRAEIYGPVYITDEQSAQFTTLIGGSGYNGYLRFDGGILHSAVSGRDPDTTVSVIGGGGYAFSVQVGKGWILDATFAVGRHFITQQGLDVTRSVLKLTGETSDNLIAGNVSFTSSTLLLSANAAYGGGSYGHTTLAMSDSASNVIKSSNVGITFRNGAIIAGAGTFGAGTMSIYNGFDRPDNKATIRATGDANALIIDTGPQGVLKNFAGSLIEASGGAGLIINNADPAWEGKVENHGIIRAVNGSKLTMSHMDVLNKGSSPDKRAVIEATDNGTVVFDNPDSVNNTNGDIRATGAGTIVLQNSQVNNGVLKLDGASTSLIVKGQNVLRNVAFDSSGLVSVEAGAQLNVSGPGSYTMAAATVAGRLSFGQDLTLKGGKTVSITGELAVSYPTLTNVDEKIEGTGLIKTASLVNQAGGTIGGSLTLNLLPSPDSLGVLTNAGMISGAKVKAKVVNNTGTMSGVAFDVPYGVPGRVINNQGTGAITGSTFGRTEIVNAGIVGAGAGQTTSFAGTILHGGTLSSGNGGVIDVKATTEVTLLDPDKIAAGTTLVVNNGATVELDGPPVLDDVSIKLAGSTLTTTLNLLSPSVTLKGGSIALSNSANNRLLFTKLTNAAGQIVGAGEIAEASPDVDSALINQAGGLIEAKGSADLTIRIDKLVNHGVLEADNSTLTIHTQGTIQGGGEALVTNGGTIDMSEVRQFLGSLRYHGRGTILGPDLVPAGTMYGFATGNSYVFGKTNVLPDQFTTKWTENAAGTGGTLTILAGAGQTYANLTLSGSYSSDDFAATQFALEDGNHVAVSFVGALKWSAAVNGNWQDAAKWGPTGLFAPGAFDNALIAAVDKDDPGKTYTVSVTQDTAVRSVATGGTATLEIEDSRFTALEGTLRATNAGHVKLLGGASFTTGGTFAQVASGEILVHAGSTLNIAKDGGISGGEVIIREGAALNAAGGTASLTGLTIANSGQINIASTKLSLLDTVISREGSVSVAQDSTLALANSTINNNTIQLRGTLEIDTDTRLKGTVQMDDLARIVSGGSAVTLTNDGNIGGAGRIGDATLTLVNKNAIVADPGQKLDIATGSNTVLNKGNMFASAGATLTLHSALESTVGLLASGGTAQFNAAVDNSGLMRAGGSSSLLDFKDSLSNSGVVAAVGGGTVWFADAVVQTADGELVADATNSKLLFDDGASVTGGQIAIGYLASLETAAGGEVALSKTTVRLHDGADVKIVNATLTIADSVVNADKTAELGTSGADSTLVLANSSVKGGTLDIDHARMLVGGTVTLKDTETVLSDATILTNGSAATLSNEGLITANGMSRIDDDFLSLVNKGTITTGPTSGAALFVNTGGFNIRNDGTISASVAGTTVTIASQVINGFTGRLLSAAGMLQAESVSNRGELKATGVGVIEVTGSVTNEFDTALLQASSGGTLKFGGSVNNSSGVIQAIGGGTVDVAGALFNDGLVQAKADGTVTANVEVNLRKLEATGAGSVLDLAFTRPDGGNRGQIVADEGGLVTVEGSVTNAAGARLVAKDGGEIEVLGAVKGGIAKISGDGSVMDLDGSATEDTTTQVSFADDGLGQLMLGHSSRFTGTVAGYDTGDTINVTDIAFVSGASFYDTNTEQLRISDGTHSATIQLLGSYAASQFAFSSDGQGGTLVTGVAAFAPAADLIPSLAAHA